MLDFFSYQLGEKFKLVGGFFLGEFYNISYQLAIDLIQFSPEEHQGSKGFGMVGYLVWYPLHLCWSSVELNERVV